MSLTDTLSNLKLSSLVPNSELSNEELALKSQWETLTADGISDDFITELNHFLSDKTYIVGEKPTTGDLTVFKAVFAKAGQWSKGDISVLAQHRHILRWVDLIQEEADVPVDQRIVLNFDSELPREVKEKKKKKTEEVKEESKKEIKKEEGKAESKEDDTHKKSLKPDAATIARQKAAKEAKKAKKAKANQQNDEKAAPVPSMIDFRVGFIEKAIKHPDADSLYVSTIHMGDEDGPRTVCSGLVRFIPLEEMQQRLVIVVANLKPVKMRGIKSSAMVLCASDPGDDKVEFVNPPAGSKAGDKIFFEGYNGTPEHVLTPKKKIWETCQPKFSTNDKFEVVYKEEGKPDARLVNEKGELCKNATLVNAVVR
ncbi:DEKNAAC103099 [Brettanomyces naardenensis]|uniref:DEKNAAC103099 n=1 Tax=Brettanomyces naardenensis TaxID=13370 RepID=A0A448YMH2_BRENA|nr:DEKNAAC103099 [Brettanomyces naardenensis]